MFGLMCLTGFVVGTLGLIAIGAIYACGRLFGFMFDLWLNDPDLHGKKKRGE